MSADKRRRARTQGRFSDPKQDNLRNREKNFRAVSQSGCSSENGVISSVRDSERHSSGVGGLERNAENCTANNFQSFQIPGGIGLLDFQTRNWTNVQKPLMDDDSVGTNLGTSRQNRENDAEDGFGKMEDSQNHLVEETEELSSVSPDATDEINLFRKNMFTYEPTKIEDVKEKKVERISETGWHILSTEPSGKSEIYFNQDFINKVDQKRCFDYLNKYIKWELKEVVSYGTRYPQPRMVSWFGPFPYGYSGVVLEANTKFPEIIQEIQKRIEELLRFQGRNMKFNSVLLNKYRDGKDSVAWHSDNELSMGVHPLIASVSLGETRKFELKRKHSKPEETNSESAEILLFLESGSLVIMDGMMQQDWLHRVPKEFHDKSTRINLTFRRVYPVDKKNIFGRS